MASICRFLRAGSSVALQFVVVLAFVRMPSTAASATPHVPIKDRVTLQQGHAVEVAPAYVVENAHAIYFPTTQKQHDSSENRAPWVNAGTDRIVELPSGESQVAVTLAGSASDPDVGDRVTVYEWSGTPDPEDIANPVVLLGLGTHTFELLAYDNHSNAARASVAITVVAELSGVTSGSEWQKWGFTPTSETVIGTITASPNNSRLDGVIAFFNGETGSLDQAAVQVRFNPRGEIDALDGTTFRAVDRLRYELGVVYDFRIVVNVPKQSFDVYVTPVDEAPVLIARDFAFNPTALPSGRISHMGIISETGSFKGRQFDSEFHTAYERVTPKTAYGWFPDTPDSDAVVNVSPTPGDGWYGTSDIHPDGTDMIFHGGAWGYARIWRYTFATKEIVPLTEPTFVAVEPAYSADGSSIVFTSDKDLGEPRFDMVEVGRTRPDDDGFKGGYTGPTNLYVMDADGQNLRRLTSGSGHVDKRGSFSPDGETVVFMSSRGATTLYMWTVPFDGSSPPTKVEMIDSPWVGRPRYSWDGEEVFFFSGIKDGAYDPYGRHTLCRVPVGGGAWRTLSNDTVGIGSHGPAPSPDGKYLWYHAFVDELWGVYKLPLAGSVRNRV